MSENIEILEFRDAVRKRPGMFLGGTGSKGIINLLIGFIRDCIDTTDSESFFFQLTIKPDYEFILVIESSDNMQKFEEILMTKDDNFNQYHLKVCKILSVKFTLKNESSIKIHLSFKLDASIFTEEIDYLELSTEIIKWTFLNRSSKVLLIDERGEYLNQNYFTFPQGVKYIYEKLVKASLGEPEFEIYFDGEYKGLYYQLFLGYRTDWYPDSAVASFANDVETVCGGSLVDGVMEGLIKACRKHAKSNTLKAYKIKKKKFSNGLILVAAVRGDDFNYGGSFKETLDSEKVLRDSKRLIEDLTIDFINNNKEKAEKFFWRFDDTQLLSNIF